MRKQEVDQFLTVSLVVNVIILSVLIWKWGTGRSVIFVQPYLHTLWRIIPYAMAVAAVYLGFLVWLSLVVSLAEERWPAAGGVLRWATSGERSPRYITIYVLVAFLVLGLGVPYLSSRAHILRSLVAEIGLAGQGLALIGSIASIFGFLRLWGSTSEENSQRKN